MGNLSSSSSSVKKHKQYKGSNRSSSNDHLSSSSERYGSGPPSAPGKPYLVVASPADEPDVITVKWKSPTHEGVSKITGYIVEHRRTISPHWVKAIPGKVQQNHLTLSGLEPGWRYQFRVKAVNSSGQSPPSVVSDPVTMTIHRTAVVAPVFVCGIEDRVALENDQVKFEVKFEGTPTPKISWYKDGFELFSNRRQRVNTDNGISTLYIHQAEYSDEGEIKCSATNKAGHAITKARLRLEAPPMVRLSQDYEEGLILEQNEPMRLKVSVSGRPLPQVIWFHDGEEIRGGDRFEVIHTDKYAALKLGCVKRSDRGCYQIQAVNPLGEHVASFLVTVTDRPSPPGKVCVSKMSAKSVTLSWKQPEDDGGCKIGNYIIEYNRVGWDMWLKATTSRQLTTDLNDLLEGSEYRFRVKAENPYGISLPSEVSEPIFLPDVKRGIYKSENATPSSLLSEDEEKLDKIQETQMFEYFGRKSKSPELSSKARKLSVNEVSPPVPQRRKKKTKTDFNNSETDIYKSCFLDISSEMWKQPIEQKDHWGLPPGLKVNNGRISPEDLQNSQTPSNDIILDYKTKGNSSESLLINFERGTAPPISLSSPELGADSDGFEEHIRNSYSSSELLFERNLNRFNVYSNDENMSSEAQKIAIYAMDRKNSLRRSPINRRSNEGSEGKSIFSDSDSIHSVVDVFNKAHENSFKSLGNSIDEKIIEDTTDTTDSDNVNVILTTSFVGSETELSKEIDNAEYESDISDEEFMKFGSGKRALEHNISSAFFSTVYCDDDYLSDQRLSDKERSMSPLKIKEISDVMSQDSLNSESISSSDDSQLFKDNNKDDDILSTNIHCTQSIKNVEISTKPLLESTDKYRPRDGIPKYVMLSNPFYKENTTVDSSHRVKFELSSNSDEIIPPEIPKRGINDNHVSLPVITVTEMSEHSSTSLLKKIIVPSFSEQNDSYFNKYNNINSSTFNTLKKSPDRDINVEKKTVNTGLAVQEDATEMIVIKHYGDIVERYSGASKKTVSKTYLDFEQLKMAAEDNEPVLVNDTVEEVDDSESEEEYNNLNPTFEHELQPDDYTTPISTLNNELAIIQAPVPNAIPYLNIFGNLSLALFGYWLYTFKDEKLSVPIFVFLSFRFFKSQIWDRI